jgi:hypothetical protein
MSRRSEVDCAAKRKAAAGSSTYALSPGRAARADSRRLFPIGRSGHLLRQVPVTQKRAVSPDPSI